MCLHIILHVYYKEDLEMKAKSNIQTMVVAAMLCAIGILIPLISPVKIILEPASFTLASHVAIFVAMFISPATAVFVALGTTMGFFLAGFPIPIVLRALSHIIFTIIGALYLKKHPHILSNYWRAGVFALVLAVIHAVSEVAIILPLYIGNQMTEAYYNKGLWYSIFGLVGLGTIVHSMVDFGIALGVWRVVEKYTFIKPSVKNKIV